MFPAYNIGPIGEIEELGVTFKKSNDDPSDEDSNSDDEGESSGETTFADWLFDWLFG